MKDYKELLRECTKGGLKYSKKQGYVYCVPVGKMYEIADAIEELQEIVKEYKKFDLYLYVRGFRWNEKERKWRDVN